MKLTMHKRGFDDHYLGKPEISGCLFWSTSSNPLVRNLPGWYPRFFGLEAYHVTQPSDKAVVFQPTNITHWPQPFVIHHQTPQRKDILYLIVETKTE